MADLNLTKTDPIGSLSSILDLFDGKTTVTTDSPTTTTTKNNLTQDQLNSIIGNAMAPVGIAQKTAGMYGSTGLAIARGQIASDVAAKYAGSTTTTSGGTRTTSSPGPLSGDRIGSTAKAMLLTQLGAPLLKKASNFSLDSLLGGTTGSSGGGGIGSLVDAAGSNGGGSEGISALFGDQGYSGETLGFGDSFDLGSLGDAVTPFLGDIGSEVLDATDTGGGLLDALGGLFVKDGGRIQSKNYAAGGFVDRSPASIQPKTTVTPTLTPDGEVDPNPQTPPTPGSTPGATPKTPTVTSNVNKQLRSIMLNQDADAGVGGSGGGPSNGTLGGAVSGFGGIALGMALGHAPSIASMLGMVNNAVNSTNNQQATPIGTNENMDAVNAQNAVDNAAAGDGSDGSFGGLGEGVGNGAASAEGIGLGEGVGGNVATGGIMRGPGTGTSDSIKANLSDGETVITAQTTKAMRSMFGDDVFHTFESIFNPKAAANQVVQGRN